MEGKTGSGDNEVGKQAEARSYETVIHDNEYGLGRTYW